MNAIQKYFSFRQSLIDQYTNGDMTKREYLKANYDAVINNDIGPFENVDTVEKAFYNYQYYNALANQMKAVSTESCLDYELKKAYRSDSNYYYRQKDHATLKALRLLDYRGIDAYFIKVKSKNLKNRLFEILIPEYNMILHSTSEVILNNLKDQGVFEPNIKKSVIDHYINQRY